MVFFTARSVESTVGQFLVLESWFRALLASLLVPPGSQKVKQGGSGHRSLHRKMKSSSNRWSVFDVSCDVDAVDRITTWPVASREFCGSVAVMNQFVRMIFRPGIPDAVARTD